MDDRVTNFLAHYASEYYDPVKAREYYLKNRELKGRKPALTKTQSEAVSYAKKNISESRKSAFENAKNANDQARESGQAAKEQKLESLQAEADAARDRIVGKLKDYIKQVKNVDNKIPKDASPKLRAFLEKQQGIRSNSASKKASKSIQETQKQLRDTLKSVREEYKAAREQQIAEYKATREKLTAKYENAAATEEQNIRKNIK